MTCQGTQAKKARIENDLELAVRKLMQAVDRLDGLVSRESGDCSRVHQPFDELDAVRWHLRGRRLRERFIPGELFGEPAWDMLLDLYAAGLEGRLISVSSACLASAVPPTTGLRWLNKLIESGLIERSDDASDARRANVSLSETGQEAIGNWVIAFLLSQRSD